MNHKNLILLVLLIGLAVGTCTVAQAQELLSPDVTLDTGASVETLVKEYRGKTYLLTVNPSGTPVQIQIRFAVDRFPNPNIALLGAGQRIPLQIVSGTFNDEMSAYDARVYEITSEKSLGGGQVVTQDSSASFPIGLYCVEDPRDFPEIAAAGFNLVQGYRFEGAYPERYSNTNIAAQAYLDAAQSAGLRVLMGLTVNLIPSDLPRDLNHIRERVLALKDHPALFGWQLYDEPESAAPPVPVDNLLQAYGLIRQLDPVHPVAIAVGVMADETYPYSAAADMVMPNYFPIPLDYPENIAVFIDPAVRVLTPLGKSVTAHIQVYNLANDVRVWPPELPRSQGRYPTREEMRFMAYYAIARGSTGVFFNCYRFDYGSVPGDDISNAGNPPQWQATASVSAELKAMAPILLGPTQRGQLNFTVQATPSSLSR